ncbi:MAG TPA: ThiF family adenylyltransferase [Verrucomicrobiae bacterium]|nr:ThiF family adenylyltransferase [Verrucomicrobiae bacterium]
MNEAEYFKRVDQIFRPEQLRTKKVMVVGLGSGGSRVASDLGRLGVSLTLVDLPGELLEEHNIVRHVLGYDSLGKAKTTELARYIRNLNLNIIIECVERDVTANQAGFRRLVERVRPDLLLACTDNQASKHAINEIAVRLGIPMVGAGVYDGGIAGEVYVTRPGAACYGCIAAESQLKDSGLKKPLNIDYNNLDLAETRSTSALNLDIAQIALIHARVALNILLSGEVDLLGLPPEVNLIVFANRRVPGHFERPLHGDFFHIKSHPDCLVCGLPAQNVNAEAERILASLPVQPGPA